MYRGDTFTEVNPVPVSAAVVSPLIVLSEMTMVPEHSLQGFRREGEADHAASADGNAGAAVIGLRKIGSLVSGEGDGVDDVGNTAGIGESDVLRGAGGAKNLAAKANM